MTAPLPEMSLPEWLVCSRSCASSRARLRSRAADRRRGDLGRCDHPERRVYARSAACSTRAHRPGGHRARPRPAAHRLHRTADGRRRRPLAARAGGARQGDPLGVLLKLALLDRAGETLFPLQHSARPRTDRRGDRVAPRALRRLRRTLLACAGDRGRRPGVPRHDLARESGIRSRGAFPPRTRGLELSRTRRVSRLPRLPKPAP